MRIEARRATGWTRVLNAARRTRGSERVDREPSDGWKRMMLLAEHSPIRLLEFDITIEGVRQWVTVHLVRHWLGFVPFVHSQREERKRYDLTRDELPQGTLNDMDVAANAQALINVSRKRLCMKASKETREAWQGVKDAVEKVDKEMASVMVRECVYRGFCPEGESCGYVKTQAYEKEREEYIKKNER